MSAEITEVPNMTPEVKRVVKTLGGIVGKSGEGFYKNAYSVGDEKVLVVHKETDIPKEFRVNYIKAEYYLSKILQRLMPDNFVNVRLAAGHDTLLVDRIQDNDDFLKAKEIRKKGYYPKWTEEEKVWMADKKFDMSVRPEFKKIISTLREMMVLFGDIGAGELSSPTNTVMVGEHPVVIDLISPVNGVFPSLDEEMFKEYMRKKIERKELSHFEAEKIFSFYGRYKKNVGEYLHALPKPKKSIWENLWFTDL